MTPGSASPAQTVNRIRRYESRPKVFHVAFCAFGTCMRAPVNGVPFQSSENCTDLVIPQTQISEKTVVLQHILAQLLYFWLVLKVEVTLEEALVQLHNLPECQVLPRSFIQSPGGLDELRGFHEYELHACTIETDHERVIIWCPQRNCLERVVNHVQELANRFPLLLPTLFEHLHKFWWNIERGPELNNRPRPEAMRMEVRQADWYNLDSHVRVVRHCAQRHERHAGFQGKEVRPVVTAACKT